MAPTESSTVTLTAREKDVRKVGRRYVVPLTVTPQEISTARDTPGAQQ